MRNRFCSFGRKLLELVSEIQSNEIESLARFAAERRAAVGFRFRGRDGKAKGRWQ